MVWSRRIVITATLAGSLLLTLALFFLEQRNLAAGPVILAQSCPRCHAFQIEGQCLAGACQTQKTVQIGRRDWSKLIPWVNEFMCPIQPDNVKRIVAYLTDRFPPPTETVQWTEVFRMPGAGWNVVSLHELGEAFFAGVEGGGWVYRTEDGTRWNEVLHTGQMSVHDLIVFKGVYYAGSLEPEAQIWTSPDGKSWEKKVVLPDEVGIISFGIFKDQLYAGTASGGLYHTDDGLSWKLVHAARLPQITNWVRSLVEFRGDLYAFTEHSRQIFRTSDGQSWTEIRLNPEHPAVTRMFRPARVFQEALYVGTLVPGEIWSSRDGKSWERVAEFSPGKEKGYVGSLTVFNGAMYAGVTTGFGSGTVYRTRDGRTWEPIGLLSPHTIEALAVFKNNLYAGTLIPPRASIYRASISQ